MNQTTEKIQNLVNHLFHETKGEKFHSSLFGQRLRNSRISLSMPTHLCTLGFVKKEGRGYYRILGVINEADADRVRLTGNARSRSATEIRLKKEREALEVLKAGQSGKAPDTFDEVLNARSEAPAPAQTTLFPDLSIDAAIRLLKRAGYKIYKSETKLTEI